MTFPIIVFITLAVAFLVQWNLSRKKLGDLAAQLENEQKKVRELAVLNDISTLFYKDLDERTMIGTIVDKSKELVRSEFSALILLENRRVAGLYTSAGDNETCRIFPKGVLEKVMDDGMPVSGRDISGGSGIELLPCSLPQLVTSFLIVPVILGGEVIGEILLANRTGGEGFSSKDEDLLLTLGFHAAVAIERARHHQEVKKLATIDGLTGLNNHRTFQERLEVEIERARRFKQHVSILMIDIDFFKRLNDTYGHRAGDEVLEKVSCRVTESIRNIDLAARYGGDEIVVILPETALDGALVTAERILNAVREHQIRMGDTIIPLTISIGVAAYPEDAGRREALIERADRALYSAKEAGRNRVCSVRDIVG